MARMSTSGVRVGSTHTKRNPSAKRSGSKAAAKAAAPSSVIRSFWSCVMCASSTRWLPLHRTSPFMVKPSSPASCRQSISMATVRPMSWPTTKAQGDVERARQLARAPALVEERVGGARRLVGEAEAELVEERHAETPAQQWQRGREVVAGRWEAVHEEQVRSPAFLRHEQPVALGQGDEAPAAVPPPLPDRDRRGGGGGPGRGGQRAGGSTGRHGGGRGVASRPPPAVTPAGAVGRRRGA